MSSHVIIYGLGSAAVAALNFVLFAIYARYLRPEDYGAMSLIVTVCSAVSMVGLLGMNNAVQRFFFDAKDDAGKRRIWGTGLVGSLALTGALVLGAGVAFRWLDRAQPALSGWAALLALVAVLPQLVLTWLQDFSRLQFQPWRFAIIGLVQVLIAGAVGLVFVAGFDLGLSGFFGGALLAALVTVAVAAAGARGAWPLAFSREELTRLVRFGAPFVPAGVFIWASSALLRWQIAHYRGLEEAGLFEVAWKLSAPVWMLNTAIGQAFGPYAFRLRAEVPDYRAKLVDIFHLVGLLTMVASCGVAVFARELCGWVVPAAYAGATLPCAILAMAFYFSALHQVTALGIAFGEQSRLIAVGWGGAALASLLLAFWLVPVLGAAGAALCVLAVYAGLNGFYLFHSQRLHPLPFRAGPILVHVAVGGLTIGLVAYLRERPISATVLAVKLGWCALVAVGLLRWGGSDVGRIRGMLRNFAAGFGVKRGGAH